jgi:hypothetical protein
MTRTVSEGEFDRAIRAMLADLEGIGSVTGPGRSGALAAVYASHILGVAFIPYGTMGEAVPVHLGRLLIIDTASQSGATLRRAARRYMDFSPLVTAVYHEPPRVAFWYESPKSRYFKREIAA